MITSFFSDYIKTVENVLFFAALGLCTSIRKLRFKRFLQWSSTSATAPLRSSDFKSTSFDAQRLGGYQRFGDNGAGAGQDATECVAGHTHHSGCRFLIKTLEIGQSDGLQLFHCEGHFARDRQSLRHERAHRRKS
jgi:hypothetical protein